MSTLKKPDLSDPKLRAKLAKGMGHNYYGEPAWPNDLLYIFPVVILGTIACVVGLAVLDPAMLGDNLIIGVYRGPEIPCLRIIRKCINMNTANDHGKTKV